MKPLLLITMILLLSGCGKSIAQPVTIFQTERMNMEMLRMENDEVICYRWDQGGLACKFKE
jgi:hypothetical protein